MEHVYTGTDLEAALSHARSCENYPAPSSRAQYSTLTGGCINQVQQVLYDDGACFVLKTQRRSPYDHNMFFVEQQGLKALHNAVTAISTNKNTPSQCYLQVPKVYAIESSSKWMLIEYFQPTRRSQTSYAEYGKALAHMHVQAQHTSYGFRYKLLYQDNNSSISKKFSPCSSWAEFFCTQRLRYILSKLHKQGSIKSQYHEQALVAVSNMQEELEAVSVEPCLLHGDLWGGNHFFANSNNVVLFDPAAYYGHHEAELALTRLFNQYPKDFYTGYYAVIPPKQGWQRRTTIYNLYHLLNHWYLFGGSYAHSSRAGIAEFL